MPVRGSKCPAHASGMATGSWPYDCQNTRYMPMSEQRLAGRQRHGQLRMLRRTGGSMVETHYNQQQGRPGEAMHGGVFPGEQERV